MTDFIKFADKVQADTLAAIATAQKATVANIEHMTTTALEIKTTTTKNVAALPSPTEIIERTTAFGTKLAVAQREYASTVSEAVEKAQKTLAEAFLAPAGK